jgi:hypothetical protein
MKLLEDYFAKYCMYITQQPKIDAMNLLKEVATNSMLVMMFPHLSDLSIAVGALSVKRSFSQMKMIVMNHLG